MKWVVLPFSESYSEETKCHEVKIYPFSCNQEYFWTNSIEGESTMICQSYLFANIPSESTSYATTFFSAQSLIFLLKPLLNKFMIRACCICWSRDGKCSFNMVCTTEEGEGIRIEVFLFFILKEQENSLQDN